MSKLIVEMEMPSICCECALCVVLDNSGRGYCKAVFDYNETVKGNAMWREMELDPNNRPTWCPIKTVLPEEHGDLIDRDALFLKYREQYDFVDEEDILSAKAIIAAERKDDGNI